MEVRVPIESQLAPGRYSASISLDDDRSIYFVTYAVRLDVPGYVALFEGVPCQTAFARAEFTVEAE